MATSKKAKNLATRKSKRKSVPVNKFGHSPTTHKLEADRVRKIRMTARQQELKKKSDSKLYQAKKKLFVKITSKKKKA